MRFADIKIEKKLPLVMVLMVAATVATLGIASYIKARTVIIETARETLETIGQAKVAQVKSLLEKIDSGINTQSRDQNVAIALAKFIEAFAVIDAPIDALQTAYIFDNPNPAGEKDKMNAAPGNTLYDRVHRTFHPVFATLKDTTGYYDIFLFDTDGNLVYSVFKEADFATNMIDGEWRKTGLANVFRQANSRTADAQSSFVDFAPYAPSFEAPAAFIARPVFSQAGDRLGVIAYQMPIGEMNAVFAFEFGETGDGYIVGSDGYLRTDLVKTEADDILKTLVSSLAIERGLGGESGAMTYTNFQSELVEGHFELVPFHGVNWVVIVEQTSEELFARLTTVLRTQIATGAVFLAVATLIAVLLSRSIGRPLTQVSAAVTQVAMRRYDVDVPHSDRKDEVGEIASALDDFRASLEQADKDAIEAAFKSSAFEATGGPMLLTDLNFKIVGSNRAFVRIVKENAGDFGVQEDQISLADLIGRDLLEIDFLPDEVKEMMHDYNKLVSSKKPLVGRSYTGLLVDVVKDRDGDPLGYVLDLKGQTPQLASQVLVQAIDGQQVRLELDSDRTIKSVNERFCNLIEKTSEELIGSNGEQYISFHDDKISSDIWQDAMACSGTLGRFVVPTPSGNRILDGSFNPVPNQHGETTGFMLLGVDVTEARAEIVEAELQAAKKATEQALVVETLSVGLKQISEGDLTVSIDTTFSEDYEQLRADFNVAISNLKDALRHVVLNANVIHDESGSINSSVTELAKRTESQAATLEETAAATHELTASVTSSAKGAENAARIANEARENAQSSGGIVSEAADAMSEIEASSDEVSKIIGVIDDIAFQTNLLALNAGVEAARAGSAGRGFAVVASEVRALAQRCLNASNEITALISSSGQQVKRGVSLVGKAGYALESIAASVLEISDNVSQIAQAAGEQSNGLGEINVALEQLDQATQHNAAMAEETSAAAQALSEEAKQLTETTNQFDLGVAATPAVPSAIVA